MGTYNLETMVYGTYLADSPRLTIWNDGFLDTNHVALSTGTMISRNLSFSNDLPSSVFFTFNDASLENDRAINFRTIKINDRYINENNFLTTDSLVNGQVSQINIVTGGFLFDDSDPDASVYAAPDIVMDDDINVHRHLSGTNIVLDGRGGNDIFYIGGGDDVLYGNDGYDRIFAGAGNDILMGGDGNDKLSGQNGNDELYGGTGDDKLNGDNGNDHLFGGLGNDKLYGNEGNDLIVGQDGNDRLNGSNGNDFLYGDAGNDRLVGGTGEDTLDGGIGNDIIYAGSEDDIIYGGEGSDVIYADTGNDIIHGNEGNDIMFGQAGNDTIYGGGSGKKSLSGGAGDDILISNSDFSITSEINTVLANNTDVFYSSDTNSFYKLFTGALTWEAAQSNANTNFLTGLSGVEGNLVTITTEIENDFVENLANNNNVWIGASDSLNEGEWSWRSGVENGINFWSGGSGGGNINSQYENWGVLNPASILTNQDYAYMTNAGDWAVNLSTDSLQYIVEWDASSLITLSDPLTILNGDAGQDELYGQDGSIDRFMINTIDAIDDIFNFNVTDHDQIFLGNILSFNAMSDDLTDFISLTEAMGDTIIAVDSDGASNGSSFTDVARIDGVTGLDMALLIASDGLIV